MNRAYSILNIKSVDDEQRIITGIASTPTPDRIGDIVDPMGAIFKTPMPLLLYHDSKLPVGTVNFARPTKDGIPFTASLPNVTEPGIVQDRVNEAWHSLKYRLLSGVSIGFKPIKNAIAILKNGGLHFKRWEWFELSLVAIPANQEATILTVKSIDTEQRAALGSRLQNIVRLKNHSGVTDKIQSLKLTPVEGNVMNIEEQIKGFEAARLEKSNKMNAIMTKAGDEGRTLDVAETEEYDTLKDEIKATDDHLIRLKEMQSINISKAVPVQDQSGMPQRTGAVAKAVEKLEKGIEFARFAMCLGAAKGDLHTAKSIAASRYPNSERINTTFKAAVEAGTTTDATWALPLVEYNQFAGDFVEFLRPQTILGKFGMGGIPSLRRVPFNIHIRGQTSGGSGYWVGEGAPKPLTAFDFEDVYLGYAKVANIAVLTQELMRFSNPSAEALVRDSLAQALIARLDLDFVDPAKAAVSNVSPASITNGVSAITASGVDADAVRVDVKAALTSFLTANISPSAGVWIMSAQTALSLSLMRNALGQKEFPDISMLGGSFEGLPVIVSEYIVTDSNGHYVILVNASDIWLADDGNVVIDASREASLQMLDDPTNNSASGTPTTMVSMFQTNSVALRAERWINWKKRRSAAAAIIENVNWGE